jgi:hypothetical protein
MCKDKDLRRAPARNNNADQAGNTRPGHGQGTPLAREILFASRRAPKKKPGAVSRPGTLRKFQFHEYYDSWGMINIGDFANRVEGVIPRPRGATGCPGRRPR